MPIWGIEAGDESIFFFPEGALIYIDDRYDPLPYKSLKVAFSSGRFFEEEDLPDDATVVERTWRFSRADGSPDPRYKKDNVEIPVVLYGLLEISTPSLPKVRLEVSDRLAAALRKDVRRRGIDGGAKRGEGRPRRRTPPGREGFRALLFEGGRRGAPFRGDTGEGGQARHGAKGSRGVEGGGGRGDQRRIQEACADPSP